MTYEVEFFQRTKSAFDGKVLRRESIECENLKSAENYGLANTGEKNSPSEADGFHIYEKDIARRTVFIRVSEQDSPRD